MVKNGSMEPHVVEVRKLREKINKLKTKKSQSKELKKLKEQAKETLGPFMTRRKFVFENRGIQTQVGKRNK